MTSSGGPDRPAGSVLTVPDALEHIMADTDTRKTERVMTALLTMKKLDIARLKRAFEG